MKKIFILAVILCGIVIIGGEVLAKNHIDSSNSNKKILAHNDSVAKVMNETQSQNVNNTANTNDNRNMMNINNNGDSNSNASSNSNNFTVEQQTGVNSNATPDDSNYTIKSILGYWVQTNLQSGIQTPVNAIIGYTEFFETENGEFGYKSITTKPTNIGFQRFNQIGNINDNEMTLNFTNMSNVIPMTLKRINNNEFDCQIDDKSQFNRITKSEFDGVLKNAIDSLTSSEDVTKEMQLFVNAYFGRPISNSYDNDYTCKNIKINGQSYSIYTSKSLEKSVIVDSLGNTYSYQYYEKTGKLKISYGESLDNGIN